MEIGKEIVKKCGGVPLAAKTLGGLLRFKREESEWEHVRDSDIWNLPQGDNSVLPALRLSYHHLPLDLRQYFPYCAVFPKDTKIEKENLITLWMAHNFLLSKGNMELEDVGNEVWKELYLRSFFQEIEVKSGKTYFKMHDLIHDLATSMFSASASRSIIRQINVKDDEDMMFIVTDYKYMISIGFSEVASSYSPSLFKRFVSLRVLNLSNSEFKQLSSSVGDLSSKEVVQASKFVFDHCPLTSMPPRIGLLTCLKTLSYFLVGERKGYQLGELQNLNLRGAISITHLERVKNDMEAKEANLSAKANLHSLSMSWDGPHRYESEEVKVLEALKPHPNLKYLEIIGFSGFRLPDWMNHSVLKNVVSILINGCENCSCLPPFGELPCRESLELQDGSVEVEYVEDSRFLTRRRSPSLRKLHIGGFCNLKGLQRMEGEEQFPVLEEMKISDCPMFVFPTLSSVKKLEIWGEADARGLSSISNLSTLTSLKIFSNHTVTSLLEEMFKSLEDLKYLSVSYLENLKELPTSLASLNNLKCLDIRYCYALESLPEEGLEGLTSLTELFVEHCNMLKCLPEGLQHLTDLTSLRVTGCPEVAKRCERGIGEDWHKIAHIPNVYIG
ncbi:hypothetical protein KY289_033810 [Solanum tuberosum]|nr:hypothetical protein KY289_033810 [Solanum tuberosum]